jgi:ribosomal protein S18 acetylase RimI-like enzyme
MTVTLRGLEPEDLPAYKLLRDTMLAAHPEAFTSDAETERAKPAHHYLARLGHGRGGPPPFTLGAFDDIGELLGAVTCERDPRVKVRHVGHVTGMMVRDTAQGRGIGRALLDACIARARASGELERLTLNVTSGNAHALRLYERAGFRRYGRLEQAIKLDGRYHDKDHLALDLSAPPSA